MDHLVRQVFTLRLVCVKFFNNWVSFKTYSQIRGSLTLRKLISYFSRQFDFSFQFFKRVRFFIQNVTCRHSLDQFSYRDNLHEKLNPYFLIKTKSEKKKHHHVVSSISQESTKMYLQNSRPSSACTKQILAKLAPPNVYPVSWTILGSCICFSFDTQCFRSYVIMSDNNTKAQLFKTNDVVS